MLKERSRKTKQLQIYTKIQKYIHITCYVYNQLFFKLLIYNQIYGFHETKTHHELMFQLTLIVKN